MRESVRNTIACFGTIIQDILVHASYAAKGKLEIAQRLQYVAGGPTCNVAQGVAGLGLSVQAVGYVGDDSAGLAVTEQLASWGVSARAVIRVAGSTGISIIVVSPDGDRTIYHACGVNHHISAESLDESWFSTWAICHIGYPPLLPNFRGVELASVVARLEGAGVVVSLDTTWSSAARPLDDIEAALSSASIFSPNVDEAFQLAGGTWLGSFTEIEWVADFLLERGVKVVIVTLGCNGCYLATRPGPSKNGSSLNDLLGPSEIRLYSEAYQTAGEINTTGAGDFFMAGFLSALMSGVRAEELLRVANLVAALHIEGSRIPGLDEVMRMTANRKRLRADWKR